MGSWGYAIYHSLPRVSGATSWDQGDGQRTLVDDKTHRFNAVNLHCNVACIFILIITPWKPRGEILIKGEIDLSGIILAFFTIMLVIVNWMLARATKNLVTTTDALVTVTKTQAEWTKRWATSDEWHRI